MNFKLENKKGFSLVEVLVGVSIIMVSLVSIMSIFSSMLKLSVRDTPKLQAVFLTEEGVEAIRTVRDFGWAANISSLSLGTNYRFYWNSAQGKWTATTTYALVDNTFDRTFSLASVNRDANFNIVNSGGTLDSNTKLVTVNVSWNDGSGTSTKTLQTYIFNTYNN